MSVEIKNDRQIGRQFGGRFYGPLVNLRPVRMTGVSVALLTVGGRMSKTRSTGQKVVNLSA